MTRIKDFSITAMIPAKLGSTRLPMKNMALLSGKPLIFYPIKASKEAGVFSKIIINSEDALFKKVAKRYGIDFYLRPKKLVKPTTKTDTVVYDFLLKNPCDIVAWVSPIAPFQTSGELKAMVDFFIKENLDSLMTVKNEQVHCAYKNKPVNFNKGEIFAQTQDIKPVQAFVYTTMIWRSDIFIKEFKRKGHALMCGKLGYFPVSKISSVIIKKNEDMAIAEGLMKTLSKSRDCKIKYDRLVKGVKK